MDPPGKYIRFYGNVKRFFHLVVSQLFGKNACLVMRDGYTMRLLLDKPSTYGISNFSSFTAGISWE